MRSNRALNLEVVCYISITAKEANDLLLITFLENIYNICSNIVCYIVGIQWMVMFTVIESGVHILKGFTHIMMMIQSNG